jgi:hypothetical protein
VSIRDQVRRALDAATHENGYPHEYDRSERDLVLEIHEFSGIDGFDPENATDVAEGEVAVRAWRTVNPKS